MNRPKKEPVKNPVLWIIIGILIALITPWYFPTGSYHPLIFGVPYWAWIIIIASLLLSAFLSYILKYHWQLEEDIEEEKGE